MRQPPLPTKHRASQYRSRESSHRLKLAQWGLAGRAEPAVRSRHFTLHVAAPSTKKKRGLKFAFSARSGHAAVRNRAKRYAREAYRVGRHKLPNDAELVISSRQGIDALTRRDMRKELAELFDRVSRHSPAPPAHVSHPSR